MTIGDILSALKLSLSLRRLWNVAVLEVKLKAEREYVEAEKQRLVPLLQRDEQIRSSKTRGVVMSIDHPVFSFWEDQESLRIRLQIRLRNPWVYAMTFKRMAVSAGLAGPEAREIYPYIRESQLTPFGEISVPREWLWKPSASELRQLRLESGTMATFMVDVDAYLSWDGVEFNVHENLTASVFVQPRSQ